jgi:Ca2+-binding EF-hand superfamily protein
MQDFALGLSILVKGSEEEKLRWTFNMYDLNGDGVITRDEMEDVVASVSQSLSTDLF